MKLNPPETAPKDRVILADFGYRHLSPAIWSPYGERWCIAAIAQAEYGDEEPEMYFENECFMSPRMRGWLPLPKIDDEGNVI